MFLSVGPTLSDFVTSVTGPVFKVCAPGPGPSPIPSVDSCHIATPIIDVVLTGGAVSRSARLPSLWSVNCGDGLASPHSQSGKILAPDRKLCTSVISQRGLPQTVQACPLPVV
ncbi:hypothetical protein PGT21_010463 [Puccinia graminis f. sp. tritici]|uniref:Uncharacterized protein n=1 Tax=Puccinia graminis f. sp. tritici TaxID=56615 RepID=A0A5B0P593_PUCGR|nr:hypothetical protein PGT21_010463 [Puccinia graminis f. sp. tritici]KAA1099126.1 hypothetical protein PGTUg99_023742 [Puccinia graminis f. sp. tritici]